MDKHRRTDPVCGMELPPPHQNEMVYLNIHFAFCSQHCMERFAAHPHLYVGKPGHKAPKQEGKEILKHRRLHLASTLTPYQASLLSDALKAMMGVKHVQAEENRVELTYDLLIVTAEQIETEITQIGFHLGEAWPERLRLAFVHYHEECEVGNLEVQEKHVLGKE